MDFRPCAWRWRLSSRSISGCSILRRAHAPDIPYSSYLSPAKPPKQLTPGNLHHLREVGADPDTLYFLAALSAHFVTTLNPRSNWPRRFKTLMRKFPGVNGMTPENVMGFPVGWEQQPLWNYEPPRSGRRLSAQRPSLGCPHVAHTGAIHGRQQQAAALGVSAGKTPFVGNVHHGSSSSATFLLQRVVSRSRSVRAFCPQSAF
jgi:hypothetical protein